MSGRVIVHTVDRRPDLVAVFIHLRVVARVKRPCGLNQHSVAEPPAPKEDGYVDVGILHKDTLCKDFNLWLLKILRSATDLGGQGSSSRR